MNTNIKKRKNEVLFQIVIIIILLLFALAALLPFWLLLISSATQEKVLLSEGYKFFTTKISFYAYKYLFVTNIDRIARSYGITLFVTIIGTTISLMTGPLLAYPLSRQDYPRRRGITLAVFMTILFNGGLVPSYLMWTQLFHVKNTIWALIFPNLLFNGFYIMLFKNYFSSCIHPALIEAAKIDGASEFKIYRKIVFPLSLPILATVGLMIGLGYWNDWMNGLYYINDPKLYSLQVLLNNIMKNISALNSMSGVALQGAQEMPSTSVRMAMAVIGVIPILLLYPFFQKYFIKGISLGAVKE